MRMWCFRRLVGEGKRRSIAIPFFGKHLPFASSPAASANSFRPGKWRLLRTACHSDVNAGRILLNYPRGRGFSTSHSTGGSDSSGTSSQFSRTAFIAVGSFTCAYLGYRWFPHTPPTASAERTQDSPPKPPEDFSHPYDTKPLWWRVYLVSKRIMVLLGCFAPFFAVSLVILCTKSPKWR